MTALSAIYGRITATRNRLYDRGTFRSNRLSRPVISVGNISVGGSGKTPFVILLGQWLNQRGITFDVLSRGYGRETRGVLAVDPDGSPREFGDEPLLIAKALKCPVVVGKSRYEAGLFAEKQRTSDYHILDDGFQHRSLARDFEIVLLSPEDLHDQLLPAGRLREPLSSAGRADVIVLSEDVDSSRLPTGKSIWRVRRSLLWTSSIFPSCVTPRRPVLFCAIARPHRFVEQVRASGVQPAAQKFYRDHHRYSERDIDDLLAIKAHHSADGFIATQKDWINLGPLYARLGSIAFPPVKMDLIEPADALDTMLRIIAERRPRT
ncbi:MAG TPA: tetraacyldisaccharide 4'-kinase [Terriglobales bacterium]|nr:tetraacyldisaccharide 4'-kinase [Terriglobales bacterium]